MNITTPLLTLLLLTFASQSIPGADWPAWRGPTADGHAASGQKLPLRWSESEHVLWSAKVRGRGHGSPTVVGDRIYLATADVAKEEQLVLCFDRATGKTVWESVVHSGNFITGGHRNSSLASSDVVSDGERLYVNFLNDSAVFTTALDFSGKGLAGDLSVRRARRGRSSRWRQDVGSQQSHRCDPVAAGAPARGQLCNTCRRDGGGQNPGRAGGLQPGLQL
jgi:hypothetical protein